MMSAQSGSGYGVELNREALERVLGLDVPWHVQYVRWMAGLFRGGPWGIIQGAISRYR